MKTLNMARRKVNSGVVIALIAVLINLITLVVFISQTNLMQEQQKAAVWPYVEWRYTYNEVDGFKIIVSNNGIGPALISKKRITLNNEVQPNLDSLVSKLVGNSQIPHFRNDFQTKVLPANSSIYLLRSDDPKWSELLFMACREKKLEIALCYESVYSEQWISTGSDVIRSNCDL